MAQEAEFGRIGPPRVKVLEQQRDF